MISQNLEKSNFSSRISRDRDSCQGLLCILINQQPKDNKSIRNADDEQRERQKQMLQIVLRRMTCTFGFCVCQRRSSSKWKKNTNLISALKEKKDEMWDQGVISCLENDYTP